jgi:hypothetical protein
VLCGVAVPADGGDHGDFGEKSSHPKSRKVSQVGCVCCPA